MKAALSASGVDEPPVVYVTGCTKTREKEGNVIGQEKDEQENGADR